ncbi:MAG: alpha-(1-_3)-arabinofuranosyltransferase domain-containing protein [Acidimicrobiales bacterium]
MKNPLPRLTSRTTKAMVRLHVGLAAVAYIPLLLTRPGQVSADTKTYLYLDPGQLMGRARSLWDPSVGMGTVTHQSVGFLWPVGPFYWFADAVGLPDWTAQRIWWGTIIFAAGAGVAYLLRTLGWRGPGVTAAVFVYALTPYLLTLVARLSAILLPFAGLPWLLAFTIRSVRNRGWRYPALFALTVATVGSVNATALLLVGLAPVLWLVHAVWGAREAPLRRAATAGLKIGALTIPVNAWWIAGLSVQGTHGIDILRYTETAEVVSSVSVSHEVLRGLGYWFFYGTDRLGPWIEPSKYYTQWVPLILLSYLLPILGLTGAVAARWRHRAYFVLMTLVGTALAVAAFPWDDPSLFGRVVKLFQQSEAGLAMRSLPRAVPLVALGLAVLLGSGVACVVRRWPKLTRPVGWGAAALAVLALPPLWLGRFVPDNLRRPEDIPDYWREAAQRLDEDESDTRVLAIPGSDFASYRWGNTVDPILPGLIDRASVARELIPYGSAASANLLNAFDLRLQERTADPDALAAIARLMRAGDLLVISDYQYERFNTPRPRNLWDHVTQAEGLGEPEAFGAGDPNLTIPQVQLDDELLFLTDPALPDPPELAVLPVTDPVPIVTTRSTLNQLLVAGDGAGLVDAAGAELIDGTELIRYSASMDDDEIAAALDNGAALLVTDSNRKRGERWTTVRHTRGYTETADGGPLGTDLNDNRLPLFPDAGTETMTVRETQNEIDAQATSYGNLITYTPEERPLLAIDGDPLTAWRTGAFTDARGERIEVTLTEPQTTDQIRLLQPVNGPSTRFITDIRMTFDDGSDPVEVTLTEQSRSAPGQVVTFPERTFSEVSIEIVQDTAGDIPRWAGESSIGFAEIEIVGADVTRPEEVIRVPTDLLEAADEASMDNPLALSLTRQRQDPTDPTRNDEEDAIRRSFTLPNERSFSLVGEARLSARSDTAPGVVDQLLGRPHDGAVPWVRASGVLTGSVATPASVFDGDPTTFWTTLRSRPANQWVEVALPEPATIDSLPLTVVADGLHSVPTEVELWVDGAPVQRIPLPEIADGAGQNATTAVELDIDPVTGTRFRVKLTGVREVTTNDWVSDRAIAQPAAIAEIGLPGPTVPPLPETFDTGCRDDLLRIDADLVPVRISGPMSDALAGRPLSVATCGVGSVDISGGSHTLRTTSGLDVGVNIDQLVLRSGAGGAAGSTDGTLVDEAERASNAAGTAEGTGAVPPPEVRIVEESADHYQLEVSGARPDEPFWLVLGQSFNDGWQATLDGTALAAPELVDGFANGWLVVPTDESFEVDLRFTPQRRVNLALWLSVVAAAGCILLLLRRPRPTFVAPSAMPEPYSPVLAFRYHGALPSRRDAYVTGLAIGVVGFLLAGPLVGLAVGIAAGLGTRHEKFRRWLLLASPAALGIGALWVAYLQLRYAPDPSFDWPIEMQEPHPLGWLAVLLLAADVIVGRVWQSRSSEITD